jgi:hypothetical protein
MTRNGKLVPLAVSLAGLAVLPLGAQEATDATWKKVDGVFGTAGVTALHSHMLAETPRLFFLHFWGVGSPETIVGALKAALAKVKPKPQA